MRHKFFLLFLFSFSLLVRLLFFYSFLEPEKNYWICDSDSYYKASKQIVLGNGISNTDGTPYFERVPGYVFFLAFFHKVFNGDIKKIVLVQIVFASFIPILLFFLFLCFFPGSILAAKIAALLSSLHLGFILHADIVMSESLFMIFFLLFMILFFNGKHFFLSGICLGVASLIRPVGQYLLIIALLIILFSKIKISQRFLRACYVSLGWMLIVGFLLLRNYMLTDHLFFHTMPKDHLSRLVLSSIVDHVDYNNADYSAAYNKVKTIINNIVEKEEKEKGRQLHEIEVCKIVEGLSVRYVFGNFWIMFTTACHNMFRTCFALHAAEVLYIDAKRNLDRYYGQNRFMRYLLPNVFNKWLIPIIYFEMICLLFVWLGFLAFMMKTLLSFNRNFITLLLQILPIICLLIALTFAAGNARLRLPVEPFLIIVACYFWFDYIPKKRGVIGE